MSTRSWTVLLLYARLLMKASCERTEPLEAYPAPWQEPWSPAHPRRCVPQVLCIGAMKSGTTSLYYYLRTPFHPGLGVPLKTTNKEPHFFNKVMDRLNGSDATEAWAKYLRLFPGVFEGDDPTSHKCRPPIDCATACMQLPKQQLRRRQGPG